MRVCLWGLSITGNNKRGIYFHGVTGLLLDKTCVVVYLFVIIQVQSNQNDGKHSNFCRNTVKVLRIHFVVDSAKNRFRSS